GADPGARIQRARLRRDPFPRRTTSRICGLGLAGAKPGLALALRNALYTPVHSSLAAAGQWIQCFRAGALPADARCVEDVSVRAIAVVPPRSRREFRGYQRGLLQQPRGARSAGADIVRADRRTVAFTEVRLGGHAR